MSGRDIEPLAFRVKPLPEECFESWLRRLAECHDTTPKALFRHLGIDAALADRDLASSAAGAAEPRHAMVERLAWATMVPEKAISGTFVGCPKADLLPLALRSIGCAQCWRDWLASAEPWRIERSWILRVTACCETHALLLTDLRGIMVRGHGNAARQLLEENVDRTRAQMARFTLVKTRLAWNGTIARAHVRGSDPSFGAMSARYRAALVGNRFHIAPARHLLLAALHSKDGLQAGQWEQIFGFTTRPGRGAPTGRARGASGPKLPDLAKTIARIGLRQLERKRRELGKVCKRLERAKENYSFVHWQGVWRKGHAALAHEVSLRRAAEMAGGEISAQTCLRGFQEALVYLQEAGLADGTDPVARCDGDRWDDCHEDVHRLRARLAACFADPDFRVLLHLPSLPVGFGALEGTQCLAPIQMKAAAFLTGLTFKGA